ncbi:bombesin receptor subtype-3-like [Diadema setosum]|uniref:bombesin receptor subtype-3-like n=1 Tax=Diadema setosum TaxID=31175 RepID=UPI003B3A72E3
MNATSSLFDPTTTMYVAFGVFGVLDNGLVLIVIARVKDLQDATNLLIANQSLIDLLTALFLLAIPLTSGTFPTNNPLLDRLMCKVWLTWYPFWALIAASGANLVVITVERFYAISHPIRYRQSVGVKRIPLLASVPWIYGIASDAHVFLWATVKERTCVIDMSNAVISQAVGIATFVFNFLGPSCSMAVLYALIAKKLRHKLREQSTGANLRERARQNVLKTLFVVCACYELCWAPNDIYSLLHSLTGLVKFDLGIIHSFTIILAFANIWINPIIYSFRYEKFRKHLKILLCRRFVPKMPVVSVSESSAKEV